MLHFPLVSGQPGASNWEYIDNDADGILDDGDFSGVAGDHPCTGGQLANCDDNAPLAENPDQADEDGDGVGTVGDNCPDALNPGQQDEDGNGMGDACDPGMVDWDHDGLTGAADNCPYAYDPQNLDLDGDEQPDACEPLDGAFGQSKALTLSQEGGESTWRRTHEPVEVPLVNGIIDASVVGYWKFDGNAEDSGLTGLTSSVTGNPIYVAGPVGEAVQVEGSGNSHLEIEGTKSIHFQQYTVQLWAHFSSSSSTTFVAKSTDLDTEYNFLLWLDANGSVVGGHLVGGSWVTAASPAIPEQEAWRHLALTYDGARISLFVDGGLVNSTVAEPPPEPTQDALHLILGNNAQYDVPFHGPMDELLVLNRALSADEIRAYYRSNLPYGAHNVPGAQADFDDIRVTETPHAGDPLQTGETVKRSRVIGPRPHSDSPCPASAEGGDWTFRDDLCGVVAYWRLDGADAVADYSGHGHDGETNGQSTLTTGRFGDPDEALEFGLGKHVFVQPSTDFHVADLTIEAWVLPTAGDLGDGVHTVLSTTEDCGYALFFLGGTLFFNYWLEGWGYHDVNYQVPAQLAGRWVHVAATRDGEHSYLYVDGVEVAHKQLAGTLGHCVQPLLIGDEPNNNAPSGNSNFLGAIDDVLVHSVAKSPDYVHNRARPLLPSVRFLANTVAVDQDETEEGTSFPARSYSLRWGNADATVVAPLTSSALGEGEECHGLLNECLGYVAWWRFNDGGGVKTVDSSTLKNTGVFVDPAGALNFAAGPESVALALDGSTNYSLIPDSASMQSPTDEVTIEGLLKVASFNSSQDVGQLADLAGRGFCDNGANSFSYRLAAFGNPGDAPPAGAGNNVCVFVQQGDGPAHSCSAPGSFAAQDGWHAVRASLSAAGGLVGTSTDLSEVQGIDAIQHQTDKTSALGAKSVGCQAGGGSLFTGAIDSVRIMSRALTEDEFLHYPLLEWEL